MRASVIFWVALLALPACGAAERDKKVGAGVALGAGVGAAAVYRATTGGCWAQCPSGLMCDRKSGTCVEAAQVSSGKDPAMAAPATSEGAWWEKERPCPEGAELDRTGFDEERRVILCVNAAGVGQGPVTFFYPNGKKQSEGEHCNGKRCGLWTHWDEAGGVSRVEQVE